MEMNLFRPQPTKSRFSLLGLAFVVSLPVFALFRLILLIRHYSDIEEPVYKLAVAMLLGAVHDIAFLSYLLIPFALYLLLVPNRFFRSSLNKLIVYVFFFACLYGLYFDLAAEWLFWSEFGVRFNFISVDYLIYTHEVVNNIIESYPLTGLLSGIFVMAAMTFAVCRNAVRAHLAVEDSFISRLRIALGLLALPLISYAAIDQSWHDISRNRFINEISANGPYQFFAAFKNNEIDYRRFYALEDDQILSGQIKDLVGMDDATKGQTQLYDIDRHVVGQGAEKHLNVVLITVESLSAEFLGHFGSRENLTPFMDQWFEQGLLFTNFYATGTRTTRGLEALTLSIPPTPGRSIVKRSDNGGMFSLGRVFQQKGYDTVFLYGGRGYFDNMNAFFSGNGYRVIDQTDLTEQEIHFENAWGVADDDLLSRALTEADRLHGTNKPFLFHIMTTSNHRPFTYPAGRIDIPSGSGRSGGVKYTDYAIGEFIKAARGKPWFDDTVFVVVADHCAGSARKAELPVDKYHIPLFIYAPKHLQPGKIDILSSQIDVAPTLLGLLNFSYDSRFFGRDILSIRPEQGRALIGNYQRLGLFKDNKLVYLAPRRQIVVVDDPFNRSLPLKPEQERGLLLENMAYYQAADYIWTHRMNRY